MHHLALPSSVEEKWKARLTMTSTESILPPCSSSMVSHRFLHASPFREPPQTSYSGSPRMLSGAPGTFIQAALACCLRPPEIYPGGLGMMSGASGNLVRGCLGGARKPHARGLAPTAFTKGPGIPFAMLTGDDTFGHTWSHKLTFMRHVFPKLFRISDCRHDPSLRRGYFLQHAPRPNTHMMWGFPSE